MSEKTTFRRGAVLAAALAAVLAGLWLDLKINPRSPDTPPTDTAVAVLPEPRPLPDFRLTDHREQPFGRADLEGYWSFLFFGYSHCPDVCPTTLAVLDGVARRLAEFPEVLEHTRFIFVSLDPERDTPERLARYVTYFNQDFIGLTGTPGAIRTLTDALGVLFMRAPGNADDYQIDHTASILLVDPGARLRALFSPPHAAEAVTADYIKIYRRYGGVS